MQLHHQLLVFALRDVLIAVMLPFSSPAEPRSLTTIFLEFPVPVVQRADGSGLEPSRNAVKVEGMLISKLVIRSVYVWWVSYVADTPGHGAFLARC